MTRWCTEVLWEIGARVEVLLTNTAHVERGDAAALRELLATASDRWTGLFGADRTGGQR